MLILKNNKIILVALLLILKVYCIKDCRRYRRDLRQHQCVLTPQSLEGPYYLKNSTFVRQNIIDFRPGIPLNLILYFNDPNSCQPIPGLWIALWQGDAIGFYSGYTFTDPRIPYQGVPGTHRSATDSSIFLRGAQKTDQEGKVVFQTIIPGWYGTRTRHIHMKAYYKSKLVFTSQIYFTEKDSDWLRQIFPYYTMKRHTNGPDYWYKEFGGKQTTLYDIKPVNPKKATDGFIGQFVYGLNLSSSTN